MSGATLKRSRSPNAAKPKLVVVQPNDQAKTTHAYSELESDIRDLERMAILTAAHTEDAADWCDTEQYQDLLLFLVFEVERRAEALRKKYYEGYGGEGQS